MKRLAVILVMLFAAGCKSHYYNARFPVLEKPDRPALVNVPGAEMKKMSPRARKDVAGNFDKLIDHVRKLEAAIDRYNEHARKMNEEFGE